MAEREASVIVKAKDRATGVFVQVFGNLNGQLNIMTGAQNKAAESANKHKLSIVDLAAKLYLVQVGLRNVAQAAREAYEFGKLGATVEQMGDSFERVVTAAGGSVNLLEQLRISSRGTISDFELMAATNQALVGTQGDVREEMLAAIPKLLEMARASSILNPQLGDTAQQFDRLTLGLKRLEPRIIDDIGLELRLTEVNRDYAAQLGKSAEALTTEERTMALLNAVLERHADYVALAGDNMESAVDPYMRFEATTKNLGNALAKQLNPVMQGLVNILNDAAEGVRVLIDWNDSLGNTIATHAKDVALASNNYKTYSDEIDRSAALAEMQIDSEGNLVKIYHGKAGAIKEVIEANVKLSESEFHALRIGDERAENIKKLNEITIGGIEDNIEWEEKRNRVIYDAFMKELDLKQKMAEKQTDINERITEEELNRQEKLTEIAEEAEQKRIDIMRDAAEERTKIDMDYGERIGDLQGTIDELIAEYEGRNPFIPEDMQQNLKLAEGNLESFEDAIKSMKRQLRRMSRDDAGYDELADTIEEQEELYRQHEEAVETLRKNARETERQNKLLFRIQELQAEKERLAEERKLELAELDVVMRAKIESIDQSEREQTAIIIEESSKRIAKLQDDWGKFGTEIMKQMNENAIDMALALNPLDENLQAMKLRLHGASEDMITDMYRLRLGIDSPDGLTGAVAQFGNQAFASLFTTRFALADLNNALYMTNFMLNQAADAAARLDSYGGGGGPGRRQHGGSVAAGHSYIVGEAGPELFTPSGNGRVTPSGLSGGGGGGGATVNIAVQSMAFQGSQADAARFGNWVAPIVLQYMDRYGGNSNAVGSRRH